MKTYCHCLSYVPRLRLVLSVMSRYRHIFFFFHMSWLLHYMFVISVYPSVGTIFLHSHLPTPTAFATTASVHAALLSNYNPCLPSPVSCTGLACIIVKNCVHALFYLIQCMCTTVVVPVLFRLLITKFIVGSMLHHNMWAEVWRQVPWWQRLSRC